MINQSIILKLLLEIDNGADNTWNSTTIGNYWDNLTGPDVNPEDGIVDLQYKPYNISGSSQSKDYLSIAEDGAPRIEIDSPATGYVFAVNAPSFIVDITDIYVDTMWYTIDGGLHNYTFTANSTINQFAWDDAPKGNVKLTFYTSDIIYQYFQNTDYIGSAEVIIKKDDEAPIIHISSPTSGEAFGVNAPSLNVSVTDDYLVSASRKYTIDGINFYSFTGNGTIDQYAWGNMSDGAITLTFSASDTLDNVGISQSIIVKDTTVPVIIIKTPNSGDVFGVNAPSFNVSITEDNLAALWYTLNGGVPYYISPGNGTIDQSAWNNMSDGVITLNFYASDTLGHIGSAEVSIIKDTTTPIIIINSPVEGERFGNNAPLFNLTITEDNLDSLTYSFDGGITTYAITNNTIFNQTAWTTLSQGEVTITFFARDLAGNEAFESVTVIKSVPSGLEPGVIITIVIVSVVGGVAVIAGVGYVVLKKRVTPE